DVPELLKQVKFEETVPNILGSSGNEELEKLFPSPALEFELYQYQLNNESVSLQTHSAEIVLVLKGNARLQSGKEELHLQKGEAAFVVADTVYSISSSDLAEVFRATVPET